MSKCVRFQAVLFVILLSAASLSKADHQDVRSPDVIITSAMTSAFDFIRSHSLQGRDIIVSGITTILKPIFHFPKIVQQVLGPRWRKLDETKRRCLAEHLQRDIIRSFFTQTGGNLSTGTVSHHRILRSDNERVTVRVGVETGSMNEAYGNDLVFLYSMMKVPDGWKVESVSINRINLIQAYKTSRKSFIDSEYRQIAAAPNGQCTAS